MPLRMYNQFWSYSLFCIHETEIFDTEFVAVQRQCRKICLWNGLSVQNIDSIWDAKMNKEKLEMSSKTA